MQEYQYLVLQVFWAPKILESQGLSIYWRQTGIQRLSKLYSTFTHCSDLQRSWTNPHVIELTFACANIRCENSCGWLMTIRLALFVPPTAQPFSLSLYEWKCLHKPNFLSVDIDFVTKRLPRIDVTSLHTLNAVGLQCMFIIFGNLVIAGSRNKVFSSWNEHRIVVTVFKVHFK